MTRTFRLIFPLSAYLAATALPLTARAQTETNDTAAHSARTLSEPADTIERPARTLSEAGVTGVGRGVRKLRGAENGFNLTRTELFRAACCNLGESFTTNPSVDVSYADAATGVRQIRLLGLSGSYVQMLTENVPAFRGASAPYSLGYVPGPWMQGIQVSKGSASVKNGYESITGQINVEYKKPQSEPQLELNLYANSKSRVEANADGNIHLSSRLSTALLTHYEDDFGHHDGNHDGFIDKARVRQVNVMNRWAWMGDNYIFQAAVSGLQEKRRGGQTAHAAHDGAGRYLTDVDTRRASAFMKNAFIFDKERGTNLALILSGDWHDSDATYGRRLYDVTQRTGYASLIFETNFTPAHSLSAGLSLNHDDYRQAYRLTHDLSAAPSPLHRRERESVPGAYAQYTFTPSDRWTLMLGLRADHSSLYGAFLTPRLHVKYAPNPRLSLRLSAGKGYRTVHAMGEYSYLLASNRTLVTESLKQEAAWNTGLSLNWKPVVHGHVLDLSAEYYYTHFTEQAVADFDADPALITLHSLDGGRSFSHTFQLEATYTLVRNLTATAAYRYNLVRQTTGGRLREKMLTPRYKGLVTLSYKTPLELWQFDLTATLNGPGRLPLNQTGETALRFPAYAQLNAQVTRHMKHWSIYAGAENLTNYRQPNPVVHAADPWSSAFDATQVWGPVHGAVAYIGVRITPFTL